MMEQTEWYVVYTKPKWEKKVAALLLQKGITNYCPLNKVRRKWSDRYKVVEEPLFKGYVFVNVADQEKWAVAEVPGVLNYVYLEGKPAKVREEEILRIKKFLQEFEDVKLEANSKLDVGEEVTINSGVLMDYKGIVVQVYGNTAKVQIQSLGATLCATLPKSMLEKN